MASGSNTSGDKPRVAVVHYHLRPGGVTRVIESTLGGLREANGYETVILAGESYQGDCLLNVQLVAGLSYAQPVEKQTAKDLVKALKDAAEKGLKGNLPDLWHIHNHSLGKVPAMADAVTLLAEEGERLLLQIHDFAEDGRPDNFTVLQQAGRPYPIADHVHYAMLNSRDRRFAVEAGLARSHVHSLPNPIEVSQELCRAEPELPRARNLIVYPTRGIRRKNIGEAVLFAAVLGDRAVVATSREPDNPVWKEKHEKWRSFSKKHQLNIHLGVVGEHSPSELGFEGHDGKDFRTWIRAADTMLTTSVAEGFGLAYLESMFTGHMLVGRDLPEITTDFKEAGLSFPGLYEHLRVPIAWVGEKRLAEKMQHGLADFYQAYGVKLPTDALDRAMNSMVDTKDRIDFGRLDEELQRKAITELLNAGDRDQVLMVTQSASTNASSWCDAWFSHDTAKPNFGDLTQRISEHFGIPICLDRLLATYKAVLGSAITPLGERSANISAGLLQSFVKPDRFTFLRN